MIITLITNKLVNEQGKQLNDIMIISKLEERWGGSKVNIPCKVL